MFSDAMMDNDHHRFKAESAQNITQNMTIAIIIGSKVPFACIASTVVVPGGSLLAQFYFVVPEGASAGLSLAGYSNRAISPRVVCISATVK